MREMLELNRILSGWLRWYRLRQASIWAVRGLIIGLGSALVLGAILMSQDRLVAPEFWKLAAGGALSGLALGVLLAASWPLPRLEAARFFDRRFGLYERVSTALELAGKAGSQAPEVEMYQKQRSDALHAARRVEARELLPVRLKPIEIGLLAAFLLFAVFLARWGAPYFQSAQERRAVQQAITEQTIQVEALRDRIEKIESLTPEQRQALTAPLEEALSRLREAETLEQAASVMNDAQQKFHAQTSQQERGQVQSLQEAGEQLSASQGSPLQQFGENLASGDYQGAAQELGNMDLASLSPSERETLAGELTQAAGDLQATNPQLSEQLQAASDALQSDGETAQANQTAAESLQQAAQTLRETGQRLAQTQAAAQAAAQIAQGQQQMVAQAGQNGSTQQGQAAGASGSGSSQQAGQTSGSGAGRGEQQGESGPGSEAGLDPIQQNNAPGDGGERDYEQIYAPQRLGGSDGEEVQLPGSGQPGEGIVGQSPSAPGAPGESTVPYIEALPAYQKAYRQAMDSGDIPVHMRSLIRDYFSSLEP